MGVHFRGNPAADVTLNKDTCTKQQSWRALIYLSDVALRLHACVYIYMRVERDGGSEGGEGERERYERRKREQEKYKARRGRHRTAKRRPDFQKRQPTTMSHTLHPDGMHTAVLRMPLWLYVAFTDMREPTFPLPRPPKRSTWYVLICLCPVRKLQYNKLHLVKAARVVMA